MKDQPPLSFVLVGKYLTLSRYLVGYLIWAIREVPTQVPKTLVGKLASTQIELADLSKVHPANFT